MVLTRGLKQAAWSPCSWIVKKVDWAPVDRASQDSESRNLWPNLLTIPTEKIFGSWCLHFYLLLLNVSSETASSGILLSHSLPAHMRSFISREGLNLIVRQTVLSGALFVCTARNCWHHGHMYSDHERSVRPLVMGGWERESHVWTIFSSQIFP